MRTDTNRAGIRRRRRRPMIALVAPLLLLVSAAGAQERFTPGDRVKCDWLQNGTFDEGVVVPFERFDLDQSGRWYRVRLDRETIPNATVECLASRLVGAGAPAGTPSRTPAAPGQLPALAGTAWKIDYGSGKTGSVFLFCRSGTWEIVPAGRGTIGAIGRSYTVRGSRLTTVNRDDVQVATWTMANDNGLLVLNDGRQTLRLHYNGTTQCR